MRVLNRAALRRLVRSSGRRVTPAAVLEMQQRVIAFVATACRHLSLPALTVRSIWATGSGPPAVCAAGATQLQPIRTLGKGTYGSVTAYRYGASRVAIKVEPINHIESPAKWLGLPNAQPHLATQDSKAARLLDGMFHGRTGLVMGIRYLGMFPGRDHSAVHAYLMPVMTGALSDRGVLRTVLEAFRCPGEPTMANAALRVVELVRRQALRLLALDARLCYTDMKISNILYNTRPNRARPELWLCDFGSAMPDNDAEYTFTFPEPPAGTPFQTLDSVAARRAALAYQIGVLLATVSGIDTKAYEHEHCPRPLATEPLQRELARHYPRDIAALVATDPAARRSVQLPLIE